jgi:hypothetical protein
MSTTTSPAPSHVSQRPPGTLNENQPGDTPSAIAKVRESVTGAALRGECAIGSAREAP